MKESIKKELDAIVDEVVNTMSSYPSVGFLAGTSGALLLLWYYNKYIDRSYQAKIDKLENQCIQDIFEGKFKDMSYCNGLSGILSVFNHLEEEKLSAISIKDIDNVSIPYLWRHIQHLMDEKKYDFLYGVMGIIQPFFFFNKGHDYIHQVLKRIYNSVEKKGDIISFPFNNYFTNEKEENLSISHGLVSVINFIIKAFKYKIDIEICNDLLEGLIKYIKKQKIDHIKYNAYYPNFAIKDQPIRASRLGWCYGDLSIALMYWEAGKVKKNPSWKQEAIEILDFATNRLDLEQNQIQDACICHGTSGIAMIFNRMFYETNFQRYKDARDYWIQKNVGIWSSKGG